LQFCVARGFGFELVVESVPVVVLPQPLLFQAGADLLQVALLAREVLVDLQGLPQSAVRTLDFLSQGSLLAPRSLPQARTAELCLLEGSRVLADARQSSQDIVDGGKQNGQSIFAFKGLFLLSGEGPSEFFLALLCLLPAE
jgi:hypothetical protein